MRRKNLYMYAIAHSFFQKMGPKSQKKFITFSDTFIITFVMWEYF